VVGVILSSNLGLLDAPGSVLLRAKDVGLPRDSVASVTQFVTVDKDYLEERVGHVSSKALVRVEAGIRLALEL
jgi:mRNA interferase MazF